ncbi:hypothetical protein BC936DRAFT_137688 [Jimgerdemannia flammicorona]|uniref:Uncharacterized protein n=1 Tax=Jimgerdemannia flammicorona TaxID=994334 RepID=A0A433DIV4_9FUNG|nr:hypothetical protein BC936DRAFT_137688 [Jimgerdemannia flammicorona]
MPMPSELSQPNEPISAASTSATSRRTTTTRQPALDEQDSTDDSSASTGTTTRTRRPHHRKSDRLSTPDPENPPSPSNSAAARRRSPRLSRGTARGDAMLDGETSEIVLRDLRKNKEFVDEEDGEEMAVGMSIRRKAGDFGGREEGDYAEGVNGTVEASSGGHTAASALSRKDIGNITLLVVLSHLIQYPPLFPDLLQGIPVGLSFGSIPFLLKARLSYSQIAVFSLSSWPYSLKLLWSPVVDSIYWPSFGRRKSWIVPIQILTGVLFLWLGAHIDGWLAEVG